MDEIDDLLGEILVDAYGDGEQLTAFETAFAESARFPFPARLVGTTLDVVKVEFEGDERRGLSAVCLRAGEMYRVSLADLTPGAVTMQTSRLAIASGGLPTLARSSSAGVTQDPAC